MENKNLLTVLPALPDEINKKSLTVLPNFTIVADKTDPNYYALGKAGICGRLSCYGVDVSGGAQVDVYKITPDSIWEGMNTDGVDFVKFLQDNAEEIPDNVMTDIKKYMSKHGVISLVGDDCIRVNDPELLKEVLNNTSISKTIYEQDGNLIFFSDISFVELQSLFSREIGYPIKIHLPRVRVFYVKLNEEATYTVKASSRFEAFKYLYGKDGLDEKELRLKLKLKRDITSEDIDNFMELVYLEMKPKINVTNYQLTYRPLKLTA